MPVQHRWSDAAAREAIERWGGQGVAEPLALRTYSARLLGADPDLVLHGGGNTSVKTTVRGLLGEAIPVLCVKGSGWDLATIEPPGHPAVRLEPLQALRSLEALSDEAMVAAQRQNLIDPAAPNPSVEALLHAFLPHTFVDHTHSTALLALADQPEAAAVCREVYGERVLLVPYVMPGFALAKACAAAWEDATAHQSAAEIEGMVMPYVMPIMHASRALAQTLAGKPTTVSFPAMPVMVKTPACPTIVAPPAIGAVGAWQVEATADGVKSLFNGADGKLLGFALNGAATAERAKLAPQLPPVLA